MRRLGMFFTLAALMLPISVQAQKKPSNSMHTRSAEVYLDRVRSAATDEERNELLNKALEILMQGIEADPGNPKTWFLAGQAYTRLGDAEAADSAFDRAESIYPEYRPEIEPERLALWIVKYNLGVAAIQSGDNDGAIAAFDAANRVYQGRPDAALTLGTLHMRSGDLTRAEAAFRTALDITQSPAWDAVEESDRAQWIEQEEEAASRLATILAQTGRQDEAIAVYRSVIRHQPDRARAKSELAAVLADAGQQEDAARIYDELLGSGGLSDIEWFNAGVRLYSGGQYELAARAFRKSIELNPYSRDSFYNLGQTLYALATAIDDEMKAAAEGDKAGVTERMTALNQELIDIATRIRELDPAFRNALMMVAQAQRTFGELSADPAVKKEWQDKVVATLEQADAMPFELRAIEYRAGPDGSVMVSGELANLKMPAGQNVTLDFTLFGEAGAELITRQVTVATAEPDAVTPFSFDVRVDGIVIGWKYTVTS